MTSQDHDALVRIGKTMASSNGYKPEQASDLYVSSGTTRDFAYGVYRIFSYTFELSAKDYPDDSAISSETGRNKAAVLYLMERAWCPLSVLGSSVSQARCGAFDDDLEVGRGWTVNPDGTDTATTDAQGRFVRGDPSPTSSSGPKQLGTVPSGTRAFVTGASAGASASANDLDGRTSARSAPIRLSTGAGQRLTFRYVFAHNPTSTGADYLKAIVEDAAGTRTTVFTVTGRAADVDGVWRTAWANLDPWAGKTIRIRLEAMDAAPGNLLEVEIDDVRVTRPA
jgi:hypothetical protein